jgi:hypothetical protein
VDRRASGRNVFRIVAMAAPRVFMCMLLDAEGLTDPWQVAIRSFLTKIEVWRPS